MTFSDCSLSMFAAVSTWVYPLWKVAAGVGVALAALMVVYFVLQLIVPRTAAIAWVAAKETLAQPFFYAVLLVAAGGLLVFVYLPYYTFGEDIKFVKDMGLNWIVLWSVVLALFTASRSIADEIDGRTALTVLSKPINRIGFILGKFLGVVGPVALVFIILGALFLCSLSFKVEFEARESGGNDATAQACLDTMVQTLPGLVLALLETIVMSSIAVAISTRLPIVANLLICFSIYVLGHLMPVLVDTSVGENEIVHFVGTFLAAVLPVLDNFNIYGAISNDKIVPWSYVAWAALYSALYSTVAILLALLMFDSRDLG
ncbi:MAG: ABC transporter permease subunit [Candidatus Nealsonbacteria bacterium]|nr:ABC transporter permease subunit [Candidatus Nealsonbacteria bacterium]